MSGDLDRVTRALWAYLARLVIATLLVLTALVSCAAWYMGSARAATLNGTVVVVTDAEGAVIYGPCPAPNGAEIRYQDGRAEIFVGLDCVSIFSDGFD